MHYFIDGYNLLFRLMHVGPDLQSQRQHVIFEINKQVALVNLNVTIVFDAHFQIRERSRSHYDAIEISFTDEGETADEFIITELSHYADPSQITVVTSDKKLAWRARHKGALTQSLEEFIPWLNRSYKNRLKKQKPFPKLRSETVKIAHKPKEELPSPKAAPEECTDYYARSFESAYEKILEEERLQPPKPPPKHPIKKPKKPKPSPWEEEADQAEKAANELERWEKIFEKRLKEDG